MDGLREGLAARAHSWNDLDPLTAFLREVELHDQGEAMIEREDIRGLWSRPSFDMASRTLGVWDGSRIVGDATIDLERRASVSIHPAGRRQGIGTALRQWTETRARELGSGLVRQTIYDGNESAVEHLARAGYTARDTSLIMRIDISGPTALATLPAGIELRPMYTGQEEHAVYELVDGALAEVSGRALKPFEDFAAATFARPDFAPDDLLVTADAENLSGAAHLTRFGNELWIGYLAVARAYRRRGLGRALLQAAFASAYERGLTSCGLTTEASRPAAIALYRGAGMRVDRTYTQYALDLG